MAKFVKPVSDIAQALNRLSDFADKYIASETNRRVQLRREKEVRVSSAYNYLIGQEEQQIAGLEASLAAIEADLESRGLSMISLPEEHRSINGPELLSAAAEGAIEIGQVQLQNSQGYKERLDARKRKADGLLRHINVFDDAMSAVDPTLYGAKHIVDPEDVQAAIEKFSGVQGEGAKQAAVNKFVGNISSLQFKLPDGAPSREDMPVIDKPNVKTAIDKITTGDIDVNPPYGDDKMKQAAQ